MVVIAGIAWGISGVSGQYLMSHGVHVNLLTSWRLLISGLVLSGLAYMTQRQQFFKALKDRKMLLGTALFSIFGLLLNQYSYLSAIQHTNAGTATVLQYMTPVIIMVVLCLKDKVWPTVGDCLAIVFAIFGTYIMATHGDWTNLAITPTGLVWGLFSAVTYALYILLPAKLIKDWGSLIVIGLAMLMSGAVFPVLVGAWQYEVVFTFEKGLALVGLVGIGTIFAYTLFLKGTSIVGPVKGSLLASVEPVASVVFGIILLQERFYLIDLAGMAMIVVAVLIISFRDLLAEKKLRLNKVALKKS